MLFLAQKSTVVLKDSDCQWQQTEILSSDNVLVFYKEPNFSLASKHVHKKVAVAAIVVPAASKTYTGTT